MPESPLLRRKSQAASTGSGQVCRAIALAALQIGVVLRVVIFGVQPLLLAQE